MLVWPVQLSLEWERLVNNMASNGFDRFQQGLASLREGFKAYGDAKETKSKKKDLEAGIESVRTNLQQSGADQQTLDTATAALSVGGGKNVVDVVNMVYKQMSRPAKEKMSQLQNRFLAERQSGTLTPQKTAAYQEELMATVKAEQLFSGSLHNIELEQKGKEKQQATDIENQAAVFRAQLGVQTSDIKTKNYLKAIAESQDKKFDVKKARVPQVVNKEVFADGLDGVRVEQQIRNINPDLSEGEVASFVWMYQNRDKQESKGVMKYLSEALQESRLFKMKNGNEEKKAEKKAGSSPVAAPDFLEQLRADEDD